MGWPDGVLEGLAVLAVLVVAVEVPPLVVLLGSAPGVAAGGPVAVQAAMSRAAAPTCSTARGADRTLCTTSSSVPGGTSPAAGHLRVSDGRADSALLPRHGDRGNSVGCSHITLLIRSATVPIQRSGLIREPVERPCITDDAPPWMPSRPPRRSAGPPRPARSSSGVFVPQRMSTPELTGILVPTAPGKTTAAPKVQPRSSAMRPSVNSLTAALLAPKANSSGKGKALPCSIR